MNVMKRLILVPVLLFSALQGNATVKERIISGWVTDAKNGEILIGATVYDNVSRNGVVTDAHGHYTLWISTPGDSVDLIVSYIGYEPQHSKQMYTETTINWKLEPLSVHLTEVTVSARRRKATDPDLASFSVNKTELDALPGFAGEKDLLKYFQLTPGVQFTGDGNSNLYVRGGSSDQNLFLLDDMPLYHVSHLGNLTSTFNSDILKTADIYLGAFPAEYGGRLSSVVDVRTKDGDLYRHHQSFTVGLLTSKLMLEGPLIEGKAAYVASFRINTLPFFKMLFDMNIGFNMYDANVKLNYILSSSDRIYFSFYTGDDAMTYDLSGNEGSFNSSIKTSWGNTAASLRYHHVFSSQLGSSIILGRSIYRYGENYNLNFIGETDSLSERYKSKFSSDIADNFLIVKVNYAMSNNIRGVLGYNFYYHTYQPGHTNLEKTGQNLPSVQLDSGYPGTDSFDQSLFAELIVDDLLGFSANAGIRENIFTTQATTFTDLQPRIILTRKITGELAIKMSYSRVWQPFHLLSNNSAGVPADYRIPAMKLAPPAVSRQFSGGLSYIPPYSDYEFSLEGYYKLMTNLTDLKEGVSYTTSYADWQNILATGGKGESKGIEILARKVRGRSTGWISATIAKSSRQFEDINGGNEYPYKYDRTFDLGCFFQQELTKKLTFSATWVFGTGMPYNLPQSQYEDIDGNTVLVYGELNQYRQKPYHRLDVGLSYKIENRKSIGIIDLSIINLYNRRNPYIYISQPDNTGIALYEFSLFPIMPSLSYSLKF